VVTYVQIRVTVICVAVSWVSTARKNKAEVLPSWGARLDVPDRLHPDEAVAFRDKSAANSPITAAQHAVQGACRSW
jgi:hypothetical protein